jgi:hypothetical protein
LRQAFVHKFAASHENREDTKRHEDHEEGFSFSRSSPDHQEELFFLAIFV